MIVGILGEAGSGKDTAGKMLVEHHGYYSLALADPIKVFCQWMFGWSAEQLWGPSELRNEPDHDLPFYRCPSCGFHWPDTAMAVVEAEMEKKDCFICPICYGQRVPDEWRSDLSPRFALQDLGTEWARYFNKRCHIDFAIKRAKLVTSMGLPYDPLWHVIPREVLKQRLTERAYKDAQPRVMIDDKIGWSSSTNSVYISDCRFRNEVQLVQEAGGKVFRIYRDQREDNTTTGMPGHASEMEQREIADSEVDGIIHNHGTLEQLQETIRKLVADL